MATLDSVLGRLVNFAPDDGNEGPGLVISKTRYKHIAFIFPLPYPINLTKEARCEGALCGCRLAWDRATALRGCPPPPRRS